jgi:hypothetical protein
MEVDQENQPPAAAVKLFFEAIKRANLDEVKSV